MSTSSSGICILSEGEFTGELWISYCLIRLAEQLAIRAGGLETENYEDEIKEATHDDDCERQRSERAEIAAQRSSGYLVTTLEY